MYERGNDAVEIKSAGSSFYTIDPSTIDDNAEKLVATTDEKIYAGETLLVRVKVPASASTDRNFELAATLESGGETIYTASESYEIVRKTDYARTTESLATQARARAQIAESKARIYERLNRSDEFKRKLVVGTVDGLVTVANSYFEQRITSVVPGLGTSKTIYDITTRGLAESTIADPVVEILDSLIPPGGYATGIRRSLVFDSGKTGHRLDDLATLYRREAHAWETGNREAALDAIRDQNDLLIDDNGAANEDIEPTHLKEAAHDQWDTAQAITDDSVRKLLTSYFAGVERFATHERARIKETLRPAAKQVKPLLMTGSSHTDIAERIEGLEPGDTTTISVTVTNAQGLANDTYLSVSHTSNLAITNVNRVGGRDSASLTVRRYAPGDTLNTASGGTTTAEYPLVDIHDTSLFGPDSNVTYELTVERTGSGAATIWYRAAAQHIAGADGAYQRAPEPSASNLTDQQGFRVYSIMAEGQSDDGNGSNTRPMASIEYSPSDPEPSEPISFDGSASSDDDGSIVSYAWDFNGDGQTDATDTSPTYTFETQGDYEVALTVTDDDGATMTATRTITVQDESPVNDTRSNMSTDGFEDDNLDEYGDVEAASLTSATAHSGANAVVITDRNEEMFLQNGHHTGNMIHRDGARSKPATLSAAVRIDDSWVNDLKLRWRNTSGTAIHTINLDVYKNEMYVNGITADSISSYTWYRVELAEIDWTANTVGEVRVNGDTVATNVTFQHPADAVSNVTLAVNAGATGAQAWFDDVTVPGNGSAEGGDDNGTVSQGALTAPFTESFDGGLHGWTINQRYRTSDAFVAEWGRAARGEGSHSEEFEQSVRLHIDGGPSTIGVARNVSNLRAGTNVSVKYHTSAQFPQPGKVAVFLYAPDGDDEHEAIVARNSGDVESGPHEISGTLSRDYPAGTQLRVVADVWPGEYTIYVTEIAVGNVTEAQQPTASLTYSPTRPTINKSVTFDGSNSSTPEGTITEYAWDVDDDGKTDATGVTITHAFESPGDHDVTLTVTDDDGTTATTTQTVSVSVPSPPDPPGTTGVSTGDPHLITFDGLAYDFQAAGEFVLVSESGGPLMIQARQIPVANRDVTVNSATATRLDGHRIMIDARAPSPVTVDGAPVTVTETDPVAVGNGRIFYDQTASTYTVVYPGDNHRIDDGDAQLVADVVGNRIDLTVHVDPATRGALTGLLGSADGQKNNDLVLANGTVLDRPPAFDVLYGAYRSDWRVTSSTSLFSYDDGKGPSTYYQPEVPQEPVTLDDFETAAVEEAKRRARESGLTPGTVNFRNALIDYLLTNETSYFDSARDAPKTPETNLTTPETEPTIPDGPVSSQTVIDRFEDNTLTEWTDVEAASLTSATAHSGTNAVVITDRNEEMFLQNGHHTGNMIHRDGARSRPSTLSAAVRIDDSWVNDLKLRWRNTSGTSIHTINLDVYKNEMYVNGITADSISSYTWYRVALAEIDWTANTVGEVRVNGNTVATDVKFQHPADAVSNVTLAVNAGATGAQAWFDDVTVPGTGTVESLSFETATVGKSALPTPWTVTKDAGTQLISDDHATDGSQSLYLTGRSGLGQSWATIDVNLTGVSTIHGDIYVESSNTFAGDIKVHIDNVSRTIMGATEKATGQWHTDLSGTVSTYEGVHTLILRTRGEDNRAYFDNIRFYNAAGDRVDASSVVSSGDDPSTIPIDPTRSLPPTVAPGDEVMVTLTANASEPSVTFTETFDLAVANATVDRVSVEGPGSVTPVIANADRNGVVVTLDGLEPGSRVTVEYTVSIPDDAATGTTYAVEGNVSSGTTRSTGTDNLTVRKSAFQGVVARYNTDGNDVIDITELGEAASDYATSDLTIAELGNVAAAYAQA